LAAKQINPDLSDEQKDVLLQRGTELPGSGTLLHNRATGEYRCANCQAAVFKSDAKYDSTTPGLIGWPSFTESAQADAVKLVDDDRYGLHRTEVICSNCGGHLGHLFEDPSSPNGQHYCINSAALDFKKKD
jgi:peptide-methionine (R)-S-oxide reductase